jgi:hypothetical protein
MNHEPKVDKLDYNIICKNDLYTSLICFKYPPDDDSTGPKHVAEIIIIL